ncbi:MAG: hypothetical protein JXQ69_09355, partial [Paludibacteraceae bacterium]|nr:hypothetical protein [Paludibacteraceae bacterium]MBN2788512.1 hypothetical protein [Paludibacteraceae bacterium]
ISKRVEYTSTSKPALTTYYVRDASGNIMGIYEQTDDDLTLADQYIYGSQRLGYYKAEKQLSTAASTGTPPEYYTETTSIGKKRYELTNHLGNVITVISDKKIPHDEDNNGIAEYYTADIINTTDYYPFGMPMPERNYNTGDYRFGFNGKENIDEIAGNDNWQDFGARMYSTRLGRFSSPDPIITKSHQYQELSTYQFASNTPIQAIDLDGLEKYTVHYKVDDGKDVIIKIDTDNSLKYLTAPEFPGGVPIIKPKVAEYIRYDSKGNVISRTSELPLSNLGSTMYVGPWNPPKNKKGEEYYLPAINSLDAAGLKHDKAYGKLKISGVKGAIGSLDAINADIELVKDAATVMEMYCLGKKDPISHKKISKESFETAENVVIAFTLIVQEKYIRIGMNSEAEKFKKEANNLIKKFTKNESKKPKK